MQSCTPPPFTLIGERKRKAGGGGGGVTVAARHDIDGGLLAELIDYDVATEICMFCYNYARWYSSSDGFVHKMECVL